MRRVDIQPNEIQSLRQGMRDLVALSMLPAIWAACDPPQIVFSLAETLRHMLALDLIYLQVGDEAGQERITVAQAADSDDEPGRSGEIAAALAPWLATAPSDIPPQIKHPLGEGYLRLVVVPLESPTGTGGVVAACRRADFPSSADELLLRMATNQALVLLRQKWAEAALRELHRRKDEFLATLAHELRNPLAAIAGAVALQQAEAAAAPETPFTVQVLSRQVHHLTRILDDLLDISRLTRGLLELRKDRVSLNMAVEHALDGVQAAAAERQQQLLVNLPDPPLWVEGDLTRLAQVVSNLLTNAVKHTHRGGHIWVSLEEERANAVLRVRDDGRGIDRDFLPQVFEPFARIELGRRMDADGLGLGLPLVKRLVELHGGSLEAHSDGLGKGSTFTVRLPCSRNELESG